MRTLAFFLPTSVVTNLSFLKAKTFSEQHFDVPSATVKRIEG